MSSRKRASLHIRRLPKELQPYALKRLKELCMESSKFQDFEYVINCVSRYQYGYGRDNKNKRAIREWLKKYKESQEIVYSSSNITGIFNMAMEHMDRLFTITSDGDLVATNTPTYWIDPFA